MSDNRRRYFLNSIITVDEFKLSITPHGTIYWSSPKGFRKLDTIWIKKLGQMSVSLPNGKEIRLRLTSKGPELIHETKNGK